MNELDMRIAGLRANMASAGIDLVAIGPTANMRYLAGYASHADERLCLVLVTAEDVKAVVPALNADDWVAHSAIPPITWGDSDGPAKALGSALPSAALRQIAVDGAMRADFLLMLMDAARAEATTPAEALIAPLRTRKSAAEIEALQKAADQADRAMQSVIDACQLDVTEAELTWVAETAFRQGGADKVEFTLIASGPNGAFPHHHSGPRKLQSGDSVIIDIGASLNDYKSDITRTIFLGEPSQAFLAAYDAVKAANQAGREAVKPGVSAQEVDRATRGTIQAHGLADYFIHRTGHGLGLEVHEPPWIMERNDELLVEDMVFSVEPGIYMTGQFGVRVEDIVVVTHTGVHSLTSSDRGLVIK
ncbi:MAG: aminopeptidase P family protein [Chloroflexi bacterium]|nr:aminopeptidase P family protein [Chloroflexota bacterium]